MSYVDAFHGNCKSVSFAPTTTPHSHNICVAHYVFNDLKGVVVGSLLLLLNKKEFLLLKKQQLPNKYRLQIIRNTTWNWDFMKFTGSCWCGIDIFVVLGVSHAREGTRIHANILPTSKRVWVDWLPPKHRDLREAEILVRPSLDNINLTKVFKLSGHQNAEF